MIIYLKIILNVIKFPYNDKHNMLAMYSFNKYYFYINKSRCLKWEKSDYETRANPAQYNIFLFFSAVSDYQKLDISYLWKLFSDSGPLNFCLHGTVRSPYANRWNRLYWSLVFISIVVHRWCFMIHCWYWMK